MIRPPAITTIYSKSILLAKEISLGAPKSKKKEPEKLVTGRPTKYRSKYCDQLIIHMSQGFSFESFCAVIEVNRDTIYEWVKVHPKFSDAKKVGREKQQYFYEGAGLKAMMGEVENFNSTAFVWMTKNMLKWRDRSEQDITTKGEKLELNYKISDES